MKISLWGMLLCLLISNQALAQSSPVPMLEQAANNIITTLKKNKGTLKQNPAVIYDAVERYLLPHVDVAGMSRSVLGRQVWMKASLNEKKAFAKAFTKLVIRTYANPLAEFNDENVRFSAPRDYQSRFTQVNSQIIRPGKPTIPVTYSLVYKKDEWKVYDLSVEGVSLLQSFRNQFAQELQAGSLTELTKQLDKKKAA